MGASEAEQRLRAASTRRKRLDSLIADARAEERAAILAALGEGMKQVEIVAITGFTREYIRRIGNPPARKTDGDQATGT